MIYCQNRKANVLAHGSFTAAATASGTVDTKGFAYAAIDVVLGAVNSTSNNPSVFRLLHSDDTEATNFATVSGFVGDTDWTVPAGVTSGSQVVHFNVDLRGKKRYLKLEVSPATTQIVSANANLHRADEVPISTTGLGVIAAVTG